MGLLFVMTIHLNNDLSLCSDKITSSSETFGDQEALELMDVLTQYLGRGNGLCYRNKHLLCSFYLSTRPSEKLW